MTGRRRSKRRATAGTMPDFGWVYSTPKSPPEDCSWCGRLLAEAGAGVWVCLGCDGASRWPNVGGVTA